MPTTNPTALAAAERHLIETRTAFWARRLPTGLFRGPACEVTRARREMFAAQAEYRRARDAVVE